MREKYLEQQHKNVDSSAAFSSARNAASRVTFQLLDWVDSSAAFSSARNAGHLVETIQALHEKNIGFQSVQENIDTTTTGGKLIFHIFSALAEFERDLIRDRTKAGLKAARIRGKKGGRPSILSRDEITKMVSYYQAGKNTVDEICKIFSISRSCFYTYLRKEKKAIQIA